jgi:Tfp pilus assembly protein PilE
MKHGPVIRVFRANQSGVTLVELVAFIVIVALLATGLIAAFTSAMKGTPKSNEIAQALQLAQERMELILAYKKSKGFTALVDPCTLATPPAQCTNIPSGFSVTTPATIVNNWNGSTEYKTITVNVTGLQDIALTAVVASY